jgi:hypothetical protein
VGHEPSSFDPLVDRLPARYVVGIDLGTTNSAVSYVDTSRTPWEVETFLIPQLVAPGQSESLETLPSFHYQPAAGEGLGKSLQLGWSRDEPTHAVGLWAREEGGKRPGRQVASAKSWLCHSGVDRTAPLLPWQAAPDADRLSPVDVTARYLAHMRNAWDHAFPAAPLADQDLVLTLPASFDEVARELTVEAASQAGLPRVVLIEEPQAAFYAWVHKHRDSWHNLVTPGQKILVCDIGGGTTDFTLIRVRRGEAAVSPDAAQQSTAGHGAEVQFHRVAVGEHLLLGGDNLDLALAHLAERKLGTSSSLDPRQWDVLVRGCRRVKETLLGENPPEEVTVHLPAIGSKLLAGSLQITVRRQEVQDLLLEGFLPQARLDEVPQSRRSGFQEFGLPFAPDAAITRYLAHFLHTHRHAGDEVMEEGESTEREVTDSRHAARPDVILFNGGFFASPVLRSRLLKVVTNWFEDPHEPDWHPLVLDNEQLHLAVARGAAYYGMVRRGEGVRITANLARSYYVGVESDPPAAVCLVPGRTLPGEHIDLTGSTFSLAISQPVEFPLYVSSTRLTDTPGQYVEVSAEQMRELPPIRTVLRSRKRSETGSVPVQLHARLSEIGTMELWCNEVGTDRRWRLQFDVRMATQTDRAADSPTADPDGVLDEDSWQQCQSRLAAVFSPQGTDSPDGLMKRLAQALESDRQQWPPSLLRRIWEELMQWEAGRRRGPAHEARWLNLIGFTLRPGYGVAVDDWRVAETWRKVRGGLAFATPASRLESMILWRRISGGLTAGQQQALAEPLLASVRQWHRRAGRTSGPARSQGAGKKKGAGKDRRREPGGGNEVSQVWLLLGSLELIGVSSKLELGDRIVEMLGWEKQEALRSALIWTLGRLGQRAPIYGPLNTVVPVDQAKNWLRDLMRQDGSDRAIQLAVMQLARKTGDRYRDLDGTFRQEVLQWLEEVHSPPHLRELVEVGGNLDEDEQGQVFGESLPKGLRLQHPS